jgi:peptidoglycan LD-endopeptidase LytH
MIESKVSKVIKYLKINAKDFAPILEIPLSGNNICIIDLSASNKALYQLDLSDTEHITNFIFNYIYQNGAKVGVGGYKENRPLYSISENFAGAEIRTIHLGIDLWAPAETVVYAPLEGKIHSFRNNTGFGNYGPTIIMEHQFENKKFFTLYGHLSLKSLDSIQQGQQISRGELLGRIGDIYENGSWPPHLHFQVITDLEGHTGDFPGVAAPSEADDYLKLCPDPNLILNMETLK